MERLSFEMHKTYSETRLQLHLSPATILTADSSEVCAGYSSVACEHALYADIMSYFVFVSFVVVGGIFVVVDIDISTSVDVFIVVLDSFICLVA